MNQGDTGSVAAAVDEAVPDTGPQNRGRVVVRRAALGTLATLLVVAVAAGWWWRIHPATFGFAAAEVIMPNPVNVPALLPVSFVPDDPTTRTAVVMESVRPHLIGGAPPGTRVSAWVCRGARFGFAPGLVAARGKLSRYCRTAVPVAGAAVDVGGDSRDLVVLRVVSSRPGTVDIQGFDLRYRSGLQDGTQAYPDMHYRVPFTNRN